MTIEELCTLRDKVIMDPSLTSKEQEFLYDLLVEKISDIVNQYDIVRHPEQG